MKYELKRLRQGYFELKDGEKAFEIEDYHPSGDYTGPVKFKKEDALKLKRFLNVFHKGSAHRFDYKIYSRIKEQLKITSGLYSTC